MSYTKRFLEKISVELGYGGEINDKVIERATKVLANNLDIARDLTELHADLKRVHSEEKADD